MPWHCACNADLLDCLLVYQERTMACPHTKLTAATAVAAAAGLICLAILQLGPPLSQGTHSYL